MRKHSMILMAATLALVGVVLFGGRFTWATTPSETPRPFGEKTTPSNM